eukprot:gene9864-biopygen16753
MWGSESNIREMPGKLALRVPHIALSVLRWRSVSPTSPSRARHLAACKLNADICFPHSEPKRYARAELEPGESSEARTRLAGHAGPGGGVPDCNGDPGGGRRRMLRVIHRSPKSITYSKLPPSWGATGTPYRALWGCQRSPVLVSRPLNDHLLCPKGTGKPWAQCTCIESALCADTRFLHPEFKTRAGVALAIPGPAGRGAGVLGGARRAVSPPSVLALLMQCWRAELSCALAAGDAAVYLDALQEGPQAVSTRALGQAAVQVYDLVSYRVQRPTNSDRIPKDSKPRVYGGPTAWYPKKCQIPIDSNRSPIGFQAGPTEIFAKWHLFSFWKTERLLAGSHPLEDVAGAEGGRCRGQFTIEARRVACSLLILARRGGGVRCPGRNDVGRAPVLPYVSK